MNMPVFSSNKFFRNENVIRIAAIIAFVGILTGCQADKASQAPTEHIPTIPGKGVTVFAAGDIADCRKHPPEQSGAAKTAALIANGLSDDEDGAVLMLGDSTYPVGLPSEYTNCYEHTWGKFKARTYPSPGNHEYYSPKAFGYYTYFGEAAGPAQRGYYSFRLGKWHIISLNSYLNPPEHQAQIQWLKAELAQNKARCTLAFWHHPMYSSGDHGNNAKMDEAWKLLNAAGAELVLASHDHHYERFAPQNANHELDHQRGIRQFVVGTGGAERSSIAFIKPNSEIADNSTYGVLKLVLKDTGYEWEFLPTENQGFTDRGAGLCR
jgi:hypothetical protein